MRARGSGWFRLPKDRLFLTREELMGGAQSLRSAREAPPTAQCSAREAGLGMVGQGPEGRAHGHGPAHRTVLGLVPEWAAPEQRLLAARHGWAAGAAWPGGKSGRPDTSPSPLAPGSRHLLRSTALGLGLVPPGAGLPAAAHGPQGLPQPSGKPPHTCSDPEPPSNPSAVPGPVSRTALHCSCLKWVTSGDPEFSDP